MLSRENLKLAAIAAFCLLVGWTGPSIAHGVAHAKFAHNADKVDGKHAVGAGASLNAAKGKLVAHGSQGKLPAKFIPNSFVTEGEYNNRPGTRLIAGGRVAQNGAKDATGYNMGIWSVSKAGTGAYSIVLKAPGLCDPDLWPPVHATPRSAGTAYYDGGTRDCTTGTFTVSIRTRNTAGDLADLPFNFTVYGAGNTVGPAPRASARSGGDTDPNN